MLRMRRHRRLLAAAVVLLAAGALYRWWPGGGPAVAGSGPDAAVVLAQLPDSVKAPEGVRVRVEVLNASRVRGLARRATQHLRDHGFDVVGMGNAGEQHDSTVVLVRAGDADWARRVARAMGGAAVETRPDSSRHLDVTVLVGATWRPPPGALRP